MILLCRPHLAYLVDVRRRDIVNICLSILGKSRKDDVPNGENLQLCRVCKLDVGCRSRVLFDLYCLQVTRSVHLHRHLLSVLHSSLRWTPGEPPFRRSRTATWQRILLQKLPSNCFPCRTTDGFVFHNLSKSESSLYSLLLMSRVCCVHSPR